jgi:NTE family protein
MSAEGAEASERPAVEAEALRRAAAPVQAIPEGPGEKPELDAPEAGTALCLSGGGYRAMLFHLGAMRRLNELGWLPKLERVSSVSGGSITAGVLARHWQALSFDAAGVSPEFDEEIGERVRAIASRTVDLPAIALGIALPGSIGNRLAGAYRRHLFGETTLAELPERPRFVFNATSLQSGVLVRFSKRYLWDYRVGAIDHPDVPLALAVAASSAFPPFLSPVTAKFSPAQFREHSGTDLEVDAYRGKLVLTDGGVYDNLGLETAWKRYQTILISDGGGHMGPKARPPRVWPLQLYRVLSVIDNQVRSLRKRQAINGFEAHLRAGAYWGIRSHVADYHLPDALSCPPAQTLALAEVKTRLKGIDAPIQERLINWGYAMCDTAMRRHVDRAAAAPKGFPFPASGLG